MKQIFSLFVVGLFFGLAVLIKSLYGVMFYDFNYHIKHTYLCRVNFGKVLYIVVNKKINVSRETMIDLAVFA